MKKKILPILSIVILAGLALIWFGANHFYEFAGDDLWYMTNIVTGEPIRSVADIWQSQTWHYMNWGGRSVGHTMLQFVLWGGPLLCDILNTIAVFGVAYLLVRYFGKFDLPLFFLAVSLIVGTTPGWQAALLWQSGVANYLYTSFFLFGFLMLYLKALEGEEYKPVPMLIAMIPLGLLAGWCNENVSPAIWLITVAVIVLLFIRKKKVPAWMFAGSVTNLIGCIMLILAPGNKVREQFATPYGFKEWLFRIVYTEARGVLHLLPFTISLAFAIFVIGKLIYKINVGATRYLLLAGAVLSWGAMILSPVSPDRTLWGTNIFLILFSLSYLTDLNKKGAKTALPLFCTSVFFTLRGIFYIVDYFAYTWKWLP